MLVFLERLTWLAEWITEYITVMLLPVVVLITVLAWIAFCWWVIQWAI